MIRINKYPVGLVSDAHTHTKRVDAIRAAHPEISQWFFIGDLLSFNTWELKGNMEAIKWLDLNINNYHFIYGNHEAVLAQSIHQEYKKLITDFRLKLELILPNNKKVLLCHNKLNDLWTFINPGYSEREFQDDFGQYIDDGYSYVIQGHTHRALKHSFPYIDTELYSIGAAKDGEYAILSEKGVEFKKLRASLLKNKKK